MERPMPTHPKRPGRTGLAVALALAAAVLAGCVPGARVEAPPEAPLVPSPAAPSPAARPSDASLCGPKPFGAQQPEDAWRQFEVTKAQLEVINRRLIRVLCREGLWRKGVGFGAGYDPDRETEFVMIHPGFSGLTARQILDRFLGR
jgi:hypothetical protein